MSPNPTASRFSISTAIRSSISYRQAGHRVRCAQVRIHRHPDPGQRRLRVLQSEWHHHLRCLRNAKTPVKLGGVAPGDTTYNTAKLLIAALKLPIQLVAGYKGTAEVSSPPKPAKSPAAAGNGSRSNRFGARDSIRQRRRRPAGQRQAPSGAGQSAERRRFRAQENAKLLLKFGGHDPSAITRPYAVARARRRIACSCCAKLSSKL